MLCVFEEWWGWIDLFFAAWYWNWRPKRGYVLCSIPQFSHLDIVLLELKKRHKFILVSYSYFTHLLWQLSADFLAPPKICSVPANFCSASAETSLCQLLLLPIRPSLLWASRHLMSIALQSVFQIARWLLVAAPVCWVATPVFFPVVLVLRVLSIIIKQEKIR